MYGEQEMSCDTGHCCPSSYSIFMGRGCGSFSLPLVWTWKDATGCCFRSPAAACRGRYGVLKSSSESESSPSAIMSLVRRGTGVVILQPDLFCPTNS